MRLPASSGNILTDLPSLMLILGLEHARGPDRPLDPRLEGRRLRWPSNRPTLQTVLAAPATFP